MAARPSAASRHTHAVTFGSRTDIGCLRDHNEDSLVVAPPCTQWQTAWAVTPQARSLPKSPYARWKSWRLARPIPKP